MITKRPTKSNSTIQTLSKRPKEPTPDDAIASASSFPKNFFLFAVTNRPKTSPASKKQIPKTHE